MSENKENLNAQISEWRDYYPETGIYWERVLLVFIALASLVNTALLVYFLVH